MFYVPQKGTETSPFINSPGEISPSSQAMAAKGELEFSPRVSQVTPRGEVLEMVQYCTFQTGSSSRVTADPLGELPVSHVTHLVHLANLFCVTTAPFPKKEIRV